MSDETQLIVERAELEGMFVKATDKFKEAIDKANEEATNAGSVAAETKSTVEALAEKADELVERIMNLEQTGEGPDDGSTKSIGEQFTDSDQFKAMVNGGARSAKLELKTALINATGQNQPLVADDRVAGVQTTPNRILRFRDLIPGGRTSSNLIQFPRESSFTNNAGPQVGGSPEAFENVTKPESALAFTLVNEPVQTLAHFIPVSKQFLDDAPALQSYINGRLMYGLKLYEDTQILTGSGANGQLNGIQTQATAYTPESPNLTNEIDIVRDAITQAQVGEYNPDFIVLNPADWDDIQRRKVGSGDDRYVYGDPHMGVGVNPLWGLRVLVSNGQTAGTFLLGDSNGAMLFDREQASVEASFEDSTNFQKNMVTIRAEERLALAVFRTEAFITGSL